MSLTSIPTILAPRHNLAQQKLPKILNLFLLSQLPYLVCRNAQGLPVII